MLDRLNAGWLLCLYIGKISVGNECEEILLSCPSLLSLSLDRGSSASIDEMDLFLEKRRDQDNH